MRTSEEIKEALAQEVPPDAIHPPDKGRGIFGDYVAAQWAIQEANNIFDWDGWTSEIAWREHIVLEDGSHQFYVDVDVTVHTKEGYGARSGRGVGTAFAFFDRKSGELKPPTPQQMDTAAKAAKSDAVKNALAQFGRHLGGELYFDERMAQVLGWETAEGRTTEREEDQVPPEPGEELAELGAVENKYGFGKEKKWQDMTLAEMYEDEDARGAMRWAYENQIESWLGSRMGRYYELMQEQEPVKVPKEVVDKANAVLDIMTGDKVQMITMWFGEQRPADEPVGWANIAKNEKFQTMVAERLNPDGKIPNFHAGHKRALNHYKAHFGIDKPVDMTWRMLEALVQYCRGGLEHVAGLFPEYYKLEPIPVKQEPPEDDPPMVIGPARNQNIPSSLQVYASKNLDLDAPDDWLWKVIGEKAIGEWTKSHTDAMRKIIEVARDGKIGKFDYESLHGIWRVVNDQIRATATK